MIDVLKKGLKLLKKCIASRKHRKELEVQEILFLQWLDGAGNLIGEEHMVEVLDNESDYEKGLEKLDMKDI